MREILFRGKQIKDGKWIEGYYCPKPYSHFPCEPTIFPVETINKDWHGERVDPETVGEYTGCHDKNGRKIFEGDIVKTKYGKICKVFWASILDYNGWGLKAVGIPTKPRPDEFDLWWSENLEVIGNIYDNRLEDFYGR